MSTPGIIGSNSAQHLSDISALNDDSRVGSFNQRSVAITDQRVINEADFPRNNMGGGRPLRHRNVAVRQGNEQ